MLHMQQMWLSEILGTISTVRFKYNEYEKYGRGEEVGTRNVDVSMWTDISRSLPCSIDRIRMPFVKIKISYVRNSIMGSAVWQ